VLDVWQGEERLPRLSINQAGGYGSDDRRRLPIDNMRDARLLLRVAEFADGDERPPELI
jgi:hypothetical protein